MTAAFVPGRGCRCSTPYSHSSMRRGSMTTSFMPRSVACLIRAPTTGWPSVGFAPMRIAASAWSKSVKLPVAPDRPSDLRIANDVGEWQTREQLSMLFVPSAARMKRCMT